MPLPSSGTLSLSRIAVTDGANSVGVVTPYSLGQLSKLTSKNFVWDGIYVQYATSISSFYNWAGYGFKYESPDILHDFGLSSRYPTNSSAIIDTSGNGRNGTFVTGTNNGTPVNVANYTTTYPGRIQTSPTGQYSVRLNDIAKYGGTQQFTWIAWFRCTGFPTSFNGIIACEGRSGSTPIGQSVYISNTSGTFIQYERWNGTSGSVVTARLTFGAGGIPAFVSGKWYMMGLAFGGGGGILSLFVDGTQYTNVFTTSVSVSTDANWGCFAGLRYNQWLEGELGLVATYPIWFNNIPMNDFNYRTRIRYDI
jgi:hypothetical protein